MKVTPIPQIQETGATGPDESESYFLLKHEIRQEPCSELGQPAREPCLALEMQLEPSSMEMEIQKPMVMEKHAEISSANRSYRRSMLDLKRNRSSSASPYARPSYSQSENRRQHPSISPVIKETNEMGNIQTLEERNRDTAQGMMIQKDHLISNCQPNEACVDKPLKSLSSSSSTQREPNPALGFLPVDTLRKLAKVNGLTGYSKLKKEELLKILREKSRGVDWREL